jgi:hypothetical protein
MKLQSLLAAACGISVIVQIANPASAVSLIDENFNSVSQNLNSTVSTPNFNIIQGNIDVIGSIPSPSYDFYPGNGNYIDLNGNTSGKIASNIFNFTTGDLVNLSFNYGANGLDKSASFSLGSLFTPISITASENIIRPQPLDIFNNTFRTYTGSFVVASDFSDALTFTSGNTGFGGIILDNIVLSTTSTSVPEPSAIPGLLLFVSTVAIFKRQQSIAKAARSTSPVRC